MKWKRAIIVGGSSGIGAELARQLATSGCKVCVVARNESNLKAVAQSNPTDIQFRVHDVQNVDEIPELFRSICHQLGGLDLVVYASGVMPEVGIDEFDTQKDASMIETNVMGCIAWLNEAAKRFQGVQDGTIVAIGSVAGDRGRRGQPVYNASKAAVATYMEALRARLYSHGVTVVTIKAGPIATPMTAHLNQSKMMPVQIAAAKILKLSNNSGEHYLKLSHRLIFAVIRNLPNFVFRRLKI